MLPATSIALARSQPWSSSAAQSLFASGEVPAASKKISVPTEHTNTSGLPKGTSFCGKDRDCLSSKFGNTAYDGDIWAPCQERTEVEDISTVMT